ncbi:MAG: GNAT family N-acetyltransferase [Chloroflexota bacterium]
MTPTIRPAILADAPAIARLHLETQLVAYQNIFPLEKLQESLLAVEETTVRKRENLQNSDCTVIAEIDAAAVGYASGGVARGTDSDYVEINAGELYNMFVLPTYQKRGIGNQLFLAIVEFLQQNAYKSLLLWSIQGTAANYYYEKLGGQAVATRQSEGPYPFSLTCYQWPQLAELQATLWQRQEQNV